MSGDISYVAFSNARRVAEGALKNVFPILKRRHDRNASEMVLIFEVDTGRQVDFNLRRSLKDVLEEQPSPKSPGRPRLGVISREISLLPRHWDWLEQQPGAISAVLRRLVEQAIKTEPGKERARRIRTALSRVLTSVAGDRPNFEEATRALFVGDIGRFESLIEKWPKDIRAYALRQVSESTEIEAHP